MDVQGPGLRRFDVPSSWSRPPCKAGDRQCCQQPHTSARFFAFLDRQKTDKPSMSGTGLSDYRLCLLAFDAAKSCQVRLSS